MKLNFLKRIETLKNTLKRGLIPIVAYLMKQVVFHPSIKTNNIFNTSNNRQLQLTSSNKDENQVNIKSSSELTRQAKNLSDFQLLS